MAILVTQTITESGLDPAYVAAGVSGDKVVPSRRTFIHVANGGASASVTVTVTDTLTPEPPGSTSFDPDLSVVIPPGGERMIGPLIESRFENDQGYVDVGYSSAASVTVAAIEI